MAKFNIGGARAVGAGTVRTGLAPTGQTGVGGPGYPRDDVRSELYLLAITHIPGETTFHEDAWARESRFRQLIREAAIHDFEWLTGLAGWLRTGETRVA